MSRSLNPPILSCLLAFLLACASQANAADAAPLATLDKNGVHVDIRLETGIAGAATLAATFTPVQPGFHLYGIDLDPKSPYTPPRIEAEAPLTAIAPAVADQPSTPGPTDETYGILPIYAKPVTLRLAIHLPPGPTDQQIPAAVRISYQTCDDHSCLQPAHRVLVALKLPGGGGEAAPTATGTGPAPATAAQTSATTAQTATNDAYDPKDEKGIHWRHPLTVADADALIAAAKAANKAAFLDFTGPSCVNCQRMAKTALRIPDVITGWNAGLPIAIDTDASEALAQWQQDRFHTQTRPLYVRIAPTARKRGGANSSPRIPNPSPASPVSSADPRDPTPAPVPARPSGSSRSSAA